MRAGERAQRREKSPEIRRTVRRRAVHAHHVELLVRVGHDIPKPGGAHEAGGEISVEMPLRAEATECIGVARWRAEFQMEAGGDRQVDDDLRRLPEMEDHCVRGVGRRPKRRGIGRQAIPNSREMALDGHRPLGQDVAVERAQRSSSESTSA